MRIMDRALTTAPDLVATTARLEKMAGRMQEQMITPELAAMLGMIRDLAAITTLM